MQLGRHEAELHLFDTAGQEDFGRLRRVMYFGADICLLCFAIDNPDSMANIKTQWMPEIKEECPKGKVILVGTKSDLAKDAAALQRLSKIGAEPVSEERGKQLAKKIGAYCYVECSAKTQEGVQDVFNATAKAMIKGKKNTCTIL